MIALDGRAGSKELGPYFKPYDVDVEVTQLEFADVMFTGYGAGGVGVSVDVEHKRIHDLVQSMRSGRLSGHQLPGLCAMFDYVFVCVEGVWRCGAGGEVEVLAGKTWVPMRVGPRSVMYSEVSNYLMTLELVCGVDVVRMGGPVESVAWLVGLYKWFQKPWEEHDAHIAIYTPDLQVARMGRRGSFVRPEVGPVEQVAAQLPGVGGNGKDAKAWGFGRVFGSVYEMVNADVKGLCKVEGVGKKGAERIYKWLRQTRG